MNICKIGLAVLAGFVLSTAIFHTPAARANSPSHVFIVPIFVTNTKAGTPADLPGNRIAGISCIPKPIPDKAPDAAICYVATTLN